MVGNLIFISYARDDGADLANQIFKLLETTTFTPWLDTERIHPGDDWELAIDHALDEAYAVLVVLTPGAVKSIQVRGEWHYAINKFKHVVPILYQECEVPRILSLLNYIDYNTHANNFANILINWIQRIQSEPVSYLNNLRTGFMDVQSVSDTPKRFDYRIDALNREIEQYGDTDSDTSSDEAQSILMEDAGSSVSIAPEPASNQLQVIGQKPIKTTIDLKGRHEERQQLNELIRDPDVHYISIIGRGGIGKTSLVCYILGQLEQQSTKDSHKIDAIVYASDIVNSLSFAKVYLHLTEVLDPLVQADLQQVLKNQQLGVAEKSQRLLTALDGKTVVLFIDNFETSLDAQGHISDAGLSAFLENVVLYNNAVSVVVTSRVPIQLDYKVLRFARRISLSDGLTSSESIELLQSLDPDNISGLLSAPEHIIKRAVQLVHGVPRGLEVLMSLLINDPLSSIDDIVDRFFKKPEVIDTLINSTYRHLDTSATKVLEAISVFKRSTQVKAIEYILEPFMTQAKVKETLRSLGRLQLFTIDRGTQTITMHPIDRDYAYNRISDTGDYSRINLEIRAAEYYRQQRPQSVRNYDDLMIYISEFEHRMAGQQFQIAAEIANEIDENYMSLWGHVDQMVIMRERLRGVLKDDRLVEKNENGLGELYNKIAKYAEAIESFEQALDIAREVGDRQLEARNLGKLGKIYRNTGEYDLAIDYLNQAIAVADGTENATERSSDLSTLGAIYRNRGQSDKAEQYLQEALQVAIDVNDPKMEIESLGHLGRVFNDLEQHQRAIDVLLRAIKRAQDIGYIRGETKALGNLGNSYLLIGNVDQARESFKQALTLAGETGDKRGQAIQSNNLGDLSLQIGDVESAISYYQQALDVAINIRDKKNQGVYLLNLGKAHAQQNDKKAARQFLLDAKKIFLEINLISQKERVDVELARIS